MIPSGRSDAMKATVLLAILVLGLCVAPLAAAAQPANTVHRIGFLWNASPSLTHHLLEAFRHGLHERGYVEGQHFTMIWTTPSQPSAVCVLTRSSCSWSRCLCPSVPAW